MPSVLDVAAYILKKAGPMTTWKLQKLVYYSQAWSLVWDEEPLFPEEICAWANGPVCWDLFNEHRGMFKVAAGEIHGDPAALSRTQRETVDGVLTYYADKPGQWLSDLTHMERPWREAREGIAPGERGNVPITHEAMADYYGGLPENG